MDVRLQAAQLRAQWGEVGDRLSLTRDQGLELVGVVALGEELFGQRAIGKRGAAGDMDLAAERRPVEQQ